jgi:hypothetical protein
MDKSKLIHNLLDPADFLGSQYRTDAVLLQGGDYQPFLEYKFLGNDMAAKKKVKLSKKSVTVTVGKTVKVKLKNNKKKVKWTVTSGKKT